MRGFTSAFVPPGKRGGKSIDPNSIIQGNVQNKIYDMEGYLPSLPGRWPINKKIAHIEAITSTPMMTENEYASLTNGSASIGIIHSQMRVPSESDAPLGAVKPEVIIWIQGSVLSDGIRFNPAETIFRLQFDLGSDYVPIVTEWFSNEWPEGSPSRVLQNVVNGKVSPHVFWTKNSQEKRSNYSQAWAELNSKYEPGENPFIQYAYSDHPGGYYELLRDIKRWLDRLRDITPEYNKQLSVAYVQHWWNQPITSSVRWNTGNSPYMRLNVQVCRQFSHGLAFTTGYPQVFPPSHLSIFGVDVVRYYNNLQTYMNYDPYVLLVPIGALGDEDFYWTPAPKGGWNMVSKTDAAGRPTNTLFVIEDERYCLGWGSVVVGWHASLGAGASLGQAFIRRKVKREYEARLGRSVEVSGHIIHALLAHDAHFAWALDELVANLQTQKSIYLPTFDEQRKGRYHTITDYQAGLEAAISFNLPRYASNRIELCQRLLIQVGETLVR